MKRPARGPMRPRLLLDGVLLIDKPLGLSSNDVLIKAKGMLRAKKAGHTGTLDPLASGLLPVCFGEATKFSQDLLDADKTYEATMQLGARSTTGDAEGEIIDRRPVEVTFAQLAPVFARFTGTIAQVPPMYSALKRDGKPLYEYARAGVEVEREAREVQILALTVLSDEGPLLQDGQVRFRVTCSKGTYVRTLAEDLGEALGCGAYLIALRRTGVATLSIDDAITLDALQERADAVWGAKEGGETSDDVRERQAEAATAAISACLQPVDALLQRLPQVTLDAAFSTRFLHGQRLRLAAGAVDMPEGYAGLVRVYAADAAAPRLLGTANWDDGLLAPARLIGTGG
ncbi:tRNA pseudouridine(55) synthase TruB [Robbsia sp. KACC 23696]|uniref:tRNA pseudouridine(55) synthase TruB n=1 Tax=Robbsia sp. KACC 23696 TaxID=3149231 RepID=UPI00325AF1FB